jgi:hypothetical protein
MLPYFPQKIGKTKQASVECSRTERMVLGRELRLALTSLFTWLLFSDNAGDPEGYVRDSTVNDLLIRLFSLSILFLHLNPEFVRNRI